MSKWIFPRSGRVRNAINALAAATVQSHCLCQQPPTFFIIANYQHNILHARSWKRAHHLTITLCRPKMTLKMLMVPEMIIVGFMDATPNTMFAPAPRASTHKEAASSGETFPTPDSADGKGKEGG